MLRQHGHHQAPVGGPPRGGPPTDVAHSTHSACSHTEAGSSGRLTFIFLLRDSQSIVFFAKLDCWAHAVAYHTEFHSNSASHTILPISEPCMIPAVYLSKKKVCARKTYSLTIA